MRHLLPRGAEVRDLAELDAEPARWQGGQGRAAGGGRLLRRRPAAVRPGRRARAACAKAGVRFEIVPGLPAATAVPAYAGIPLTSEPGGDVRIVHAADVSRLSAEPQPPRSLVILGARPGRRTWPRCSMAAGWPERTPFTITWNGTTTEQLTIHCALGSVSADLKAAGVSLLTETGPAVAVVGEAAGRAAGAVLVRDQAAVRLAGPGPADQGPGRLGLASGCAPTARCRRRCRPSRSSRRAPRSRWSARSRAWSPGATSGSRSPRSNAVRAVREKLEEYGLDARAFAGVKVAAVGEQTGRALLDFGIKPDLVPEGEQSGEGLAAAWQPYDSALDPINRVLLPRADIATETLVARLNELGWETEDVTAYRTVRAAPPPAPIREAIKGGGFDAVLFTSSSTVRNLIGIAGKPHAVTVIAVIGPQTAKTAAEFGLRVDVKAPKPSATGLVDALAEYAAGVREAAIAAGEPVRKPSERRRGARRRLR